MGDKFDPNIHDAQFMIQQGVTDDNENTVGHVMQTGWKIGDRVLRAAKVGIFKKPQWVNFEEVTISSEYLRVYFVFAINFRNIF